MADRTIIALIGSHSTGKTTLAAELVKALHPIGRTYRPDVSWTRYCGEVFGDLNDQVLDGTQMFISFGNAANLLSATDARFIIAERFILDNIAYTEASTKINPITCDIHRAFLRFLTSRHFGDRILWCYLPIEFAMEKDGVRKEEEEYRQRIDFAIKRLFVDYDMNPLEVRGSVSERVEEIMQALQGFGALAD